METLSITPASQDASRAIAELQPVFLILLRTLVDKPEAVDLKCTSTFPEVVFEVCVDTSDLGKIIGKNGRNAKSLRTLLMAASKKYDIQVQLDIPAPEHPGTYVIARETFHPGPPTSIR